MPHIIEEIITDEQPCIWLRVKEKRISYPPQKNPQGLNVIIQV